MTQMEKMLRYIRGFDLVAEVALSNRFGPSFEATLKELAASGFVTLKTEYRSSDVISTTVTLSDTWHITSKGEEWLLDLDTERQMKRVADWWARGLAIAALLIAFIALLKQR